MEVRNIRASVGLWDLDTGKLLEGHQPDLALVPASTAKIISTYAILKTLKPDYELSTEVWGDLRGGTVPVVTGPLRPFPLLTTADGQLRDRRQPARRPWRSCWSRGWPTAWARGGRR